LLESAVGAGVIRKIEIRSARNPNKWDKQLAPWFTEECRLLKRQLITARR
jgi:hypothetical protein